MRFARQTVGRGDAEGEMGLIRRGIPRGVVEDEVEDELMRVDCLLNRRYVFAWDQSRNCRLSVDVCE